MAFSLDSKVKDILKNPAAAASARRGAGAKHPLRPERSRMV